MALGGAFTSKPLRSETPISEFSDVTHPAAPKKVDTTDLSPYNASAQEDLFLDGSGRLPLPPDEILIEIMERLSQYDLMRLSQVSKTASALVNDIMKRSRVKEIFGRIKQDMVIGKNMRTSAIELVTIISKGVIAQLQTPAVSDNLRLRTIFRFITDTATLSDGKKIAYVAPSHAFFAAMEQDATALIDVIRDEMAGPFTEASRGPNGDVEAHPATIPNLNYQNKEDRDLGLLSFFNVTHIMGKIHHKVDAQNAWYIRPMVGDHDDPAYVPPVSLLLEFYARVNTSTKKTTMLFRQVVVPHLVLVYNTQIRTHHYLLVEPFAEGVASGASGLLDLMQYTQDNEATTTANIRISYVPRDTQISETSQSRGTSQLPATSRASITIPVFCTGQEVRELLQHLGCNLWCSATKKWVCAIIDHGVFRPRTYPNNPMLMTGGVMGEHSVAKKSPREPVTAIVLVALIDYFYYGEWDSCNDFVVDLSSTFEKMRSQEKFKQWENMIVNTVYVLAYNGLNPHAVVRMEVLALIGKFFDVLLKFERGPRQRTLRNLVRTIFEQNIADITAETLFTSAHQQDFSPLLEEITRMHDHSHNTKKRWHKSERLPLFSVPKYAKGIYLEIEQTNFQIFSVTKTKGCTVLPGESKKTIPVLKIVPQQTCEPLYKITRVGHNDSSDTKYTVRLRQYLLQKYNAAEYVLPARATSEQLAGFFRFIGFGLPVDHKKSPLTDRHAVIITSIHGEGAEQ